MRVRLEWVVTSDPLYKDRPELTQLKEIKKKGALDCLTIHEPWFLGKKWKRLMPLLPAIQNEGAPRCGPHLAVQQGEQQFLRAFLPIILTLFTQLILRLAMGLILELGPIYHVLQLARLSLGHNAIDRICREQTSPLGNQCRSDNANLTVWWLN